MAKITIYNVKDYEKPFYEDLNKYDFDLNFVTGPLTAENTNMAEGSVGVLIDGSTNADADIFAAMKNLGVKYVFTRFVGYNNIDLKAASARDITVARVPSYSPYSVAELALTMGVTLTRHVAQATTNTHLGNFMILPSYFAKEIDQLTVGIIGVGHMGAAEAKLYHNLGAKVLGYQRHPNDNPDVSFVDETELLASSDIVSIHVPYFPGENDMMIGATEIGSMKDDAILVNTARGELVDTGAVTAALDDGTLGGYAADVVPDENQIFGKQFDSLDDLPDQELLDLMKKYPNVIITPHMGYDTEPALEDMIKVSYENFHDVLTKGETENQIK
ncbi:lactate dehydrogenase [Fructilactobacillus lindneri]|uniref:Lactate dehydrogenase n=1 Tax=Fructilactobacillus lindneri TaxID=53444 RepID=A0AB33BML7_9LACO|nr:NAD(P)-dependent oxidoreductase [Fructilactobacillus lindneri]ANZ57758.1 lactate dehydrogenase [Fructilactobacillus lindneri]ANZ59027.1 lactate dehydrogenase [Fructilactobacillus lindneri]POG98081.1 lactate dehydrogenase [Fructilactobacillus lindneri]POH01804.1 lactate dehydrogenase [Fructilactobacillus lindneri]POH03649.1 lactate dehydrogenase [Fructilactobacillus lindneri]